MIGRPSASSSVIPGNVWKCIWHLKTPPKVRNFMWRALSRALATMENLFKRRCSPSPCGPICLVQDEFVEHMLLLCPWVEPIWFGGPLNYRSVNGFLEASVASEGHPQRNLSCPGPPACWGPPGHPFLKVNVDASWEASSKSGFAGVVIRDHAGKFVAARRGLIGASTVAAAEAAAILLGCELAKALALACIIVESDSKENILCLAQGCSRGSWEAFPVISKALRLGGLFQDCRWSWVPRSANLAAHVLASRSIPEMCDVNWVNFPPSSLVHVLNKDGLPCPH
ncbi:hypothetical protein D8674_040231 [Pyrus ussuriensis x Pyrus communis]|uniref:Uncharacterized protein n=1 Tax=Pyrus ussuriensis x Pyrus communis TaxID=2448454 RepID=A0A5N5HCF6_9ROSA|nr:hypothetical protein D8674_040231 [Pyrus ussuriensis x Pyrus communis]